MESLNVKAREGRDEQGRWLPGISGNPGGAKPDTEEDKLRKKALKKVIEEYTGKLTEALPEISPVLIEKAKNGDLMAIKEINDRVLGKPKQQVELSGDKENPIPILNVPSNNSNKESNGDVQENQGDSGRDSSQQDSINNTLLDTLGTERQDPETN